MGLMGYIVTYGGATIEAETVEEIINHIFRLIKSELPEEIRTYGMYHMILTKSIEALDGVKVES